MHERGSVDADIALPTSEALSPAVPERKTADPPRPQSFEIDTTPDGSFATPMPDRPLHHDRRPSSGGGGGGQDAPWTDEQKRDAMKRAIAANVGNVLEWYDFAVYSYLAEVFGAEFFDFAGDKTEQLYWSYGIFGGAFLMRPIGGVVMGRIGDRVGRKRALEISILLMATATFLLGCLPTYKQVGIAAPLLLASMRMVQGLSVGGQLVGSFVFTIESAPPGRRALFGGMCMATSVLGTMLGSVVGAVLHSALDEDALHSWGWRVPFLCGVIVGIVGLKMQHGVDDSPEFLAMKASGVISDSPFRDAMTRHPRQVLLVIAVAATWCVCIYMGFTWIPQFQATIKCIGEEGGEPDPTCLITPHSFTINAVTMLLMAGVMFPALGMIADRVGTARVILFGACLILVVSPICFWMVSLGHVGTTLGAQLVFGLGTSAIGAGLPTWMIDSFAPQLRYSAVAVGYNVAHAVFSGSSDLLATIVYDKTGSAVIPGIWISFIATMTIAALCWSASGAGRRYLWLVGDGQAQGQDLTAGQHSSSESYAPEDEDGHASGKIVVAPANPMASASY